MQSDREDKNNKNENHWDKLDEPLKCHVLSFFNTRELAKSGEVDKKDFYRLSRDPKLQQQALNYAHLIKSKKCKFGTQNSCQMIFVKGINKVILADFDGELKVFDYLTEEATTFSDSFIYSGSVIYEPKITCLAELSDNRIVTATADRALHILDLKTGQRLQTSLYLLPHQYRQVICIAELKDGNLIFSDNSSSLYIWDLQNKQLETFISDFNIPPILCLEFLSKDCFVTGSRVEDNKTNVLNIWDLNTKMSRNLPECTQTVRAILKMKDKMITASNDIRIWDIKLGKCQKILNIVDGNVNYLTKVTDTIFASESAEKMDGGAKSVIRIWNAETGECLNEIQRNLAETLVGLPNGNILLGNGEMLIFNSPNAQLETENKPAPRL